MLLFFLFGAPLRRRIGLSDHNNAMGKVVAYSNQLVQIFNDRNFPGEHTFNT